MHPLPRRRDTVLRLLPVMFVPVLALGLTVGSYTYQGQLRPSDAEHTARGEPRLTAAPDPAPILDEARASLRAAGSVRLTGQLLDSEAPVALDVRLTTGGAAGTLIREGTAVELLRLGDQLWLRGDAFWLDIAGPAAAEQAGGRWIKVSPDDLRASTGELDMLAGLDALTDELLRPSSPVSLNGTGRVREVPTLVLGLADGGLLDVSAGDVPLPLRLRTSGPGGEPQQLDFTGFGDPVDLTAPADAVAGTSLPGLG